MDITLLAKLNAFLLSYDSVEYNGMNEVVNAPSAKNARNRLAKRNEEKICLQESSHHNRSNQYISY